MGYVGVSALVKTIMGRYDHNRNGVIDLQSKASPAKDRSTEVERREVRNTMDYMEISVYSHKHLFAKADANGDGKVTSAELTAAIRPFDTDNDGKLKARTWVWNKKEEYDLYEDALGEDLVSQIHIPIGPPNPPFPPHPHTRK